jgi:hypothetical protein
MRSQMDFLSQKTAVSIPTVELLRKIHFKILMRTIQLLTLEAVAD